MRNMFLQELLRVFQPCKYGGIAGGPFRVLVVFGYEMLFYSEKIFVTSWMGFFDKGG